MSRSVVIADDHGIIREALTAMLTTIDDIEIAGEADNGIATIAMVKDIRPELLLLDAAMPLARGVEVYAESKRWSPETKVAVVTGFTSTTMLADWINAGVDGLFLKSCPTEELRKGIELILAGGQYVSDAVSARIAEANNNESADVTPREREVLALIAAGYQNAGIAERLHISAKTVEKHRASLMAKVGVNSVSGLLVYALREGLLDEHRQL